MEYIPNNLTATDLIISKGKNYEFSGYFYNAYDGIYVKFDSLLQLLKELDNLFDRFAFPQVTHEYRTFSDHKYKNNTMLSKEIMMNKNDNKPGDTVENVTFVLKVQFRRNASWQGQIQWVDKRLTQTFRSTLELIRLIDTAIGQDDHEIMWETKPSEDEY